MTHVVELAGVRKRYRRVGEVLTNVELTLAPGGAVVVVGANGSGKSTLLRIAAGCSAPTAGTVTGRPPVVGYVPAQFPASSRLSVRTYLRHMTAIHGGGADAAEDSAALLDDLGFSGSLDGPVAELSTGNAQKVGLAQALSGPAPLVVLDEPFTGLDDAAADALCRRLGETMTAVAVLIADHSGRALALPNVHGRRLHHGTLHHEPTEPRRTPIPNGTAGTTSITLWCSDPAATLRGLPHRFSVTDSDPTSHTMTLEVAAAGGDALLVAAVGAGCSVLAVTRGSR
ncbi:MAG: ABC transporter ATP-binding protein [Pseudonocardia sp.]|nr:ABC transporter ATP-binding protein [Pseudonocardia sp.]